jgi:hypothetical protein
VNDRWIKKDGTRWNSAEKARVAKRFRSYIRTPSNPTGRIHREPCFFCVHERLAQGYTLVDIEQILPKAEGHHVDYNKPFVVIWSCGSHHRQIDHGTLLVPRIAICDYTSLVKPLLRPWILGNKNAVGGKDAEETSSVPF